MPPIPHPVRVRTSSGWQDLALVGPPGPVMMTGTYLARPAATTVQAGVLYFATDTLGTWRSDGTSWTLVEQRAPLISTTIWNAAPFTTPYDGQEVILEADSANGVYWRFRYYAASASAYKWMFVGGSSLRANVTGDEGLVNDTAWHTFPTNVVVTAPRAGDYELRGQARFYTGVNTRATLGFGIGGSPDARVWPDVNGVDTRSLSIYTKATVASGATVALYYLFSVAPSAGVFGASKELAVTPVRVS